MKVLAIDIGGTHVKLLVTGQKEHSEFACSPELTPAMLLPATAFAFPRERKKPMIIRHIER